MKENHQLDYEAPEITVFEMLAEGYVMRQSHQHDDESEWES